MERKKNERTNEQDKPIESPQYKSSLLHWYQVIHDISDINTKYTKFEVSSFYSSWEIFDKKFNIDLYREKEEWENKWTNKLRKPIVSNTI